MAGSPAALQTTPAAASRASGQPAVAGSVVAKPEAAGVRGRVGSNGLVCTDAPVLGSRLPVRRCRSPAELAARRQQDQQALDLMQRLNDPGSSMKLPGT
jgi:hypothetical protein